jgi:hypothetical protein
MRTDGIAETGHKSRDNFFEFLRGIALAPFAPHDLPIWARAS